MKRLFSVALLAGFMAVAVGSVLGVRHVEAQENAAADADRDRTNLTLDQERVRLKYQEFHRKLATFAQIIKETDPARADLLEMALKRGQEKKIQENLEKLVVLIRQDLLGTATKKQTDVRRDLTDLLRLLLTESRPDRLADVRDLIKDVIKRINLLIKDQQGIEQSIRDKDNARKIGEKQLRIAKETKEVKNKLAKGTGEGSGKGKAKGKAKGKGDGEGMGEGGEEGEHQPKGKLEKALQRIREAEERMREAKQKLEKVQREGAADAARQATIDLQKAVNELQELLKQLREKEKERLLADLEARFKKMLEMQMVVYESTLRLDRIPQDQRNRTFHQRAGRLTREEWAIEKEAKKTLTLLREDGTTVAMPEAVTQMIKDMKQVQSFLSKGQTGELPQGTEEDVISALEEMIEALKKARRNLEEDKGQPPGPPPPSGPQGDPPLIDLLAELKMLKSLQMRVNDGTKRFSRALKDPNDEIGQATKEDLRNGLDQLSDRQNRLYRATRDLVTGRNR